MEWQRVVDEVRGGMRKGMVASGRRTRPALFSPKPLPLTWMRNHQADDTLMCVTACPHLHPPTRAQASPSVPTWMRTTRLARRIMLYGSLSSVRKVRQIVSG